jgi:hypothetical protein
MILYAGLMQRKYRLLQGDVQMCGYANVRMYVRTCI